MWFVLILWSLVFNIIVIDVSEANQLKAMDRNASPWWFVQRWWCDQHVSKRACWSQGIWCLVLNKSLFHKKEMKWSCLAHNLSNGIREKWFWWCFSMSSVWAHPQPSTTRTNNQTVIVCLFVQFFALFIDIKASLLWISWFVISSNDIHMSMNNPHSAHVVPWKRYHATFCW
jgi:hypothetical protein